MAPASRVIFDVLAPFRWPDQQPGDHIGSWCGWNTLPSVAATGAITPDG